MTWNFRVFKVERMGEEMFSIREAYYDDAGDLDGFTGPIAPQGDTVDDLRKELQRMLAACDRPVLDDTA